MSTSAISPPLLSQASHFQHQHHQHQHPGSSSPSTPLISKLPSNHSVPSFKNMQIHGDYFNSPHHSSRASTSTSSSKTQSARPQPAPEHASPSPSLTSSPLDHDDDDEQDHCGDGKLEGNGEMVAASNAEGSSQVGARNSMSEQPQTDQRGELQTTASTSPSSSPHESRASQKQSPCTEISRTPSASTTHTQHSALESSGCESQDSNGEGTVPSSVASSQGSKEAKEADREDEKIQLDHASSPSERSEKSLGKMRTEDDSSPPEGGEVEAEAKAEAEEAAAELEPEETTILGSSREGSGSTSTPMRLNESDLEGNLFSSRPASPTPVSTPGQTSRDAANSKTTEDSTGPPSSSPYLPSSSTSDPLQAQRKLRRLYALLELVDTEKSYAQDMNALVRVYFPQLRSMPFFSSGNQISSNSNSNSSSSSNSKPNFNQNTDLSSSSSSIAIPDSVTNSSTASLTSGSPVVGSISGSPMKPMTSTQELSANPSSPPSPSLSPIVLPKEKNSLGTDRWRAVVRNAEELYQLTNKISAGLTAIIAEAGIAGEDLNKASSVGSDGKEKSEMDVKLEIAMSVNAEAAVHVIAEYFTTLAPSFSIYRNFASRHAEALAVVREAERRTSDWAAYEKRCADILRRSHGSWSAGNSTGNSSASSRANTPAGSRRGSEAIKPSSLTVTPIDAGSSADPAEEVNNNSSTSSPISPAPTPSLGPAFASPSFSRQASSAPPNTRLVFADFFIKPIQRLCLLPLMLQSVLKLTAQDDPARPQLVEAVKAMKQVADDVDEAGRQREMQVLAHLVTTRMERNPVSTGPSSYSSSSNGSQASGLPVASSTIHLPSPPNQPASSAADSLHSQNCSLTASQLSAFGPCLLAGSLDVLHHHSRINPLTLPLRFKYHGAFLYGSWIMLVKVQTKRPHAFEARHCFPLWAARLTPLEDSNKEKSRSLLPHSFRISVHDHHFECGASTAAEKQIWLEALSNCIRTAEVAPPRQAECASWPSSLQLVADGEMEEEEDEEEEEIEEEREEVMDKKKDRGRGSKRRPSIPDPLSNIWAQFPSTSTMSNQTANGASATASHSISSAIPLKLASPSQRASHDRYMLTSQSLLAARTKDSSAAHDALVLWQKQNQHSLSVPSISAAVSSRMGLNKLGRNGSNSQSASIENQIFNSNPSGNFNGTSSSSKLQRRKSFAGVLDLMSTMTASPESIMRQHQLQQQQSSLSPTFRNPNLPEPSAADPETNWRSTFKRRSNRPRPSTMIITPEMLANVAAQTEATQPKSSQSAPGNSEATSPLSIPAQSSPPLAGLSPPLPPPLDLTSIAPSNVVAADGTLLPISAVSNASAPPSSPGTSPRISPPQSRSPSQVRLSSVEQVQPQQQTFSKGHSRSRSGAGTSTLSQAVKDALSASYGFHTHGNGGGKRSRTRSGQTDISSMESSVPPSEYAATPPNRSPMGASIALPESRRSSINAVSPPISALPSEFGVEGGALGLVSGQSSPKSGGSLSRRSGASIRRAFTSGSLTPRWSRHQTRPNDQGLNASTFIDPRADSSVDSLALNPSTGSSAHAVQRGSSGQASQSEGPLNPSPNSSKMFKSGFVSSLRRARSAGVTSTSERTPSSSSASINQHSNNNSASTLIADSSSSGSGGTGTFSKRRWPKLRSGSSSSVKSGVSESIPPMPSPVDQVETRRPSFGRRLLSNRFSMTSSAVSTNSQSSQSFFNPSASNMSSSSGAPFSTSNPSSVIGSRRASELDSVIESEVLVVGQVAAEVGEPQEEVLLESQSAEQEEEAAQQIEEELKNQIDFSGTSADHDKTIKSRPNFSKRPSTSDGIVQKEKR